MLHQFGQFIEHVSDFSRHTAPMQRQARVELSLLEGGQRAKNVLEGRRFGAETVGSIGVFELSNTVARLAAGIAAGRARFGFKNGSIRRGVGGDLFHKQTVVFLGSNISGFEIFASAYFTSKTRSRKPGTPLFVGKEKFLVGLSGGAVNHR